jgi:hypothetical protein
MEFYYLCIIFINYFQLVNFYRPWIYYVFCRLSYNNVIIKITRCQMVEWLMNNELERTWKEVIVV